MRYKIIPILALLMLVLAVPARADLITQSYSISGLPQFNDTATFNQYNNSGTLNSILIEMGITISGGLIFVDNDSPSPATVDGEVGTEVELDSSDVVLPSAFTGSTFSAFFTHSFNLEADDGDGVTLDFTAPDGSTWSGGTYSDTMSGSVLSSDFAAYMGAGTYDINIDAAQHHLVYTSGGVQYGFSPVNVSGYINVTYDYTPTGGGGTVPEPGTMILFASGLGAVAAYRMRRKKKKSA